MVKDPVEELAAIAAIDPDFAPFLAPSGQTLKDQFGPIAVLQGSGGHDDHKE
jgi:hypothetical protein